MKSNCDTTCCVRAALSRRCSRSPDSSSLSAAAPGLSGSLPPGLAEVTAQWLGVGDGVTTTFPLIRSYGAYGEPVAGTSGISTVYFDGAPQPSDSWSATPGYGPAVAFATAPAAGVVVSADFGALWLCRFAEDALDFEEFMAMLFALNTVKLTTVRP
jgi:hypothetical protein